MRQTPDLWKRAERIQWGCVLMQLLGETSLEQLHIILTGLRSIEHSHQVAPFERAVRTTRSILGDLLTKNAVQSAVYDFLADATQRSFIINPDDLSFTPIYAHDVDANILKAQAVLTKGLRRVPRTRSLADPTKDLLVALDRDHVLPIRLHGFSFPTPRKHDQAHRPRQSIIVRIAELIALAAQLDEEDRVADHQPANWTQRLNFDLLAPTGQGLQPTDVLDLTHLKHLIGLPGAGKTTLITLLCILLSRRGLRVAVFFTSIQVARDYLEVLRGYQVKVAMLMGRSDQTHRRHANGMAELIAGQGNGGFGYSRSGIELFATSCPLPAFADTWPTYWKLGDAPCEAVSVADAPDTYLCPAWEVCGRVKNQRALVDSSVWLGHVISADTSVPAHTSEEQMRYFELIAETFDLVIFDECDETQKVLDEYGALTLELTGVETSLHSMLQQMTRVLASNTAPITDGFLGYMLKANEFERHTLRLLNEIRRLAADKRTERVATACADKLLTAAFLLRAALEEVKLDVPPARLSALSDFWERAMYHAFFLRAEAGDAETGWPKAEKHAPALNITVADGHARWRRLNRALIRYLQLDHAAAADSVIDDIAGELADLLHIDVHSIRSHVRLLVAVGFTVASYQRLATSARPLAQRGEIPETLVFAKASAELREVVPRSILGTFSAVRYRKSPDKTGYVFDYLVMDLTPRLLMHRLHEFGRANVLLTSATSCLAPSTQYHVQKKPDYVLSPRAHELGVVRLRAFPQFHPSTRQPLRFSGGGVEREENLRHMVTALVQANGAKRSELEKAVRSVVTRTGRQRKAALVVNSYDQVRLVVEQIHDVNPTLGMRTRGVVNELPTDTSRTRYVLKGQVETLGDADDVDVVVFPIAALGRGVNIVFHTPDNDNGCAAVGSIYFLTRPHPAAGDLSLMISLLARATQELDQQDFTVATLAEVKQTYNVARYGMYRTVANLLARPMSASQLHNTLIVPFAANLLVPILQTIGRGIRKQMPIDVYFVDAAWAPHSADGGVETDRSSLLVVMRRVLDTCLTDADPDLRDVYQALYGVFRQAFSDIDNVNPPQTMATTAQEVFSPSSMTHELDLDGYDPDTDLYTDDGDEVVVDFDDSTEDDGTEDDVPFDEHEELA